MKEELVRAQIANKDLRVKADDDRVDQSGGGRSVSATLSHLPRRGLSATGRADTSNGQPLPTRSGGCIQVGRVMRRSRRR